MTVMLLSNSAKKTVLKSMAMSTNTGSPLRSSENNRNLLSSTFERLRLNKKELLLLDGGTGEEL